MPRPYSKEKRAAQEAETRRRILDATMALHAERGVLRAKPIDIAARANVAVTTYYKHFPTLNDLVLGCTSRGRELAPPPDPATITALPSDPAMRVATMVRTLFEYYELREPWLYSGRTEERFIPELQAFMGRLRALRDAFIRVALEPAEPTREAMAITTALVDYWAWRTLRREVGLTQEEVIRVVIETIKRAAGIALPSGKGAAAPPA